MINALRWTGFVLMAAGALLLAGWFIEPLRQLGPVLMALPPLVKIGLAVAAIGLAVVFGSLLAERFASRQADRELKDD